jgi:hypothetical protein
MTPTRLTISTAPAARSPSRVAYCETHDHHYSSIEQCAQCRASASVVVEHGPPKVNTSEKRVNAANARLRELACWNQSKLLMPEDGHVAVKWSSEATKWARIAMELEGSITEIEHDQWLVDQKRKLGN